MTRWTLDPARVRLGLGSVLVIVACGLCFQFVDRPLALLLKDAVHGPVETFFKAATNLGRAELYLVPAALFWAWARLTGRLDWARRPAFLFLSMAAAGLTELAAKYCLGRMRPRLFFEQGAFGFEPFTNGWAFNSFPSGHSQAGWAAMTALAILRPRLTPIWTAVAVVVAVSRVMLTVHWMSDAIAGAWIGFAWAVFLARLYPPVRTR